MTEVVNAQQGELIWDWYEYIGVISWLAEWQERFEKERTIAGPGTGSMYEYNSSGMLLARGINSEGAEGVEFIVDDKWELAQEELIDQFIFLSSLINHLNLDESQFKQTFATVWASYLHSGNGQNGGMGRLEKGMQIVKEHEESYAATIPEVDKTVFELNEFSAKALVRIQQLISYEATEGILDQKFNGGETLPERTTRIAIHLGYIFQVLDMSVDDVKAAAGRKMEHNEEKYSLDFFGKGDPINVALRKAKNAFNNGAEPHLFE